MEGILIWQVFKAARGQEALARVGCAADVRGHGRPLVPPDAYALARRRHGEHRLHQLAGGEQAHRGSDQVHRLVNAHKQERCFAR